MERVERHLIRQRGAGVRNLATSFGFSLGLAIAPIIITNEAFDEPPAKRRKSDHIVNEERAGSPVVQAEASAAEVKPKVRRRFETVIEDEAPIVRDDGRDVFKPTVKKKGRRKKTLVHVEVEEVPMAAVVPERRPRRQAAASATVKVTEGFVEEATSIDKKRRDPEPDKPVRKGRKKAVAVVTTDAEVADSNSEEISERLEPTTIFIQQQDVQPVDNKKAKSASRPTKRKLKTKESPTKRIPLGETHANLPSKSPEKQAKAKDQETERCYSPASPVRKVKAKAAVTKRVSKKISTAVRPSKITGATEVVAIELSSVQSHDRVEDSTSQSVNEVDRRHESPARTKPASKAAKSRTRKPAHAATTHSDGDCEAIAEKPEACHLPPPPVEQNIIPSSTALEEGAKPKQSRAAGSTNQPGQPILNAPKLLPQEASGDKKSTKEEPCPPKKQKVPLQSKCADIPQAKARTKSAETTKSKAKTKPAQLEKPPGDEEDVDWLFETIEKRKTPSRQSKRKAPTKSVRRAQSPEVDLDEMLSNIASWAPKRR